MTNHDAQASRALLATLGGQAIAALGILIQWAAAPEVFPGFPPGLFYIFGACAIVWFDRRAAWSPVAAIILALWIIVGGIGGGDLTNNLASSNIGLVAGNVVMVVGLIASAAAGALAIVYNRRRNFSAWPKPLAANNPRRTAVIVMVAGLLLEALGVTVAERLEWEGAGPTPFVLLAVLVAFVRGRTMPALAILLSAVFLLGSFTNPEPLARLSNLGEPIGFGFQVLQVIGLATAIVAGIATMVPKRANLADNREGATLLSSPQLPQKPSVDGF